MVISFRYLQHRKGCAKCLSGKLCAEGLRLRDTPNGACTGMREPSQRVKDALAALLEKHGGHA
jgi:hypothetical protein